MNLLLGTHALIWFLEDDARLGRQARKAIADSANCSHVSDVTAWEMGIKFSIGKLKLPAPYEELFPALLEKLGFHLLPIRHEHLHRMVGLPWHHRDPFDRLLIAQSKVEGMTLISCDPKFQAYGLRLLW